MNDRVSPALLRRQGPPMPAEAPPSLRPSRWFTRLREPQGARFRLFCFPYAGAGASVFRNWRRRIDARVDVVAVQLPGRGARLDEAPVTDFDLLSSLLAEAILHEAGSQPFGFFGHSMGALLMFEVARRMAAAGARLPGCVFASGRRAPHLPELAGLRARRRAMSDADFVEELRRLQGTPTEILDNAELLGILMPTIRGDFALLDSWRFADSAPLDVPLYALTGGDDPHVDMDAAAEWSRWTRTRFELLVYAGGHFFLHEQEPRVVRDVSDRLADLMCA